MSTLDKSFIRAYSKDADVRGMTGPAWYSPDCESGDLPDEHEFRDPRLDGWRPSEQLYTEGIWYRIEPRQSSPPLPHWSLAAPVRPRNDRPDRHSQPILAETVDDPDDVAVEPTAAPTRPAQQAELPWLLEFTSQYVISAAVECSPAPPSPVEIPPVESRAVSSDAMNMAPAAGTAAAREASVAQATGVASLKSPAGHAGNSQSSVSAPTARQTVESGSAPTVMQQAAAPAAPANFAPASPDSPRAAPDSVPTSPQGVEVPRLDEPVNRVPTPHFAVTKAADETRGAPSPRTASSAYSKSKPRAARRFAPSWEVDAFVWPELIDRLLRRETRRFTLLAEKLAGVARTGRNVVAVTSPSREQGRTTLALCLARRAAAAGLNVALVDADFENPTLAQQLRVNPTCGWQDTLSTHLPLTEAAVASTRDHVTLLPLRVDSVGRDDETTLDPSAVTQLIDQLSQCFDLVIIDMEPVEPEELDDTDQALDASYGETSGLHEALVALLLFDEGSDDYQLEDAIAQLRSAGIETLGAVENFCPAHARAG